VTDRASQPIGKIMFARFNVYFFGWKTEDIELNDGKNSPK
jgi:hypothetical protein